MSLRKKIIYLIIAALPILLAFQYFPNIISGVFYDKGGATYNVKAYGAVGNGVTNDITALNAAATAALHGGIVEIPNGTYAIGSTFALGLNNSGTIFQCSGNYFNTVGGTVIKWIGAANGTMVKLDGSYNIQFRDCTFDGNNTAGRGAQLISSASSTSHNVFKNCNFQNFTGTPGYATSVGETAVSNVSENIFDNVRVSNSTEAFYQDGNQTFTWLKYFYAGNNTIGFDIKNGWLTSDSWEYGGTGIAYDITALSAKSSITDGDYEGTGKALQVEDGTNWNYLNFTNNRILWDTAPSTPGTVISLGTTTGTTGTYNLTNNKFSTLSANSTATIFAKTDLSHSLYFNDLGSTYITSPSPTVLSFVNNIRYNKVPDFNAQLYGKIPSTYFNDFLDNAGVTGFAIGAASGNAFITSSASFNSVDNPGVHQISTGTGGSGTDGKGTGEGFQISGTYFTSNLNSSTAWQLKSRILIPTTTNAKYTFGFQNVSGVSPTDAIIIYFDSSAGANWECQNIASGVGNPQDSGIAAVTSTFITVGFQWDGTILKYLINDTVVATSTTNIPSAIMRLYWQALALSTSNTYLDADYVSWRADSAR